MCNCIHYPGVAATASLLFKLMPPALLTDDELDSVIAQYANDLPHPHLLSVEVKRWKHYLETNLADKSKITNFRSL